MEAGDWIKLIEKKLEIAQRNDQEKVLFVAHQLSPGMSLKLDLELTTYLMVS
jgi:hypothetical protein